MIAPPTRYVTKPQSNGKLKRGPMVSVRERNYSEQVPDDLLRMLDARQLVLDDNDHSYTVYFDGKATGVIWGPSADGDDSWFYRIGGMEQATRVVGRDTALRAAIVLPALLHEHTYEELIFGGMMCLTCSPKEGEDGYGDPDTTVGWPCPPLREGGLTDEQAVAFIKHRRAEIERKAREPGEKAAAEFNKAYPVETVVRYWKGAAGVGIPLTGKTIEPAKVWGLSYTAVVRVQDVCGGTDYIALTHVQVPQAENATEGGER